MTTLSELTDNLRALGIRVWEDQGQLAYSAPKGALTPALLSALRAHKQNLLSLLRKPERAPGPPPLAPQAEDRSGPLPLSFAQQRLWFMQQLGDPAAYNLPAAWRLGGRLHTAALAAALTGIVERHEALRTVFESDAGRAAQVVLPPRPVLVPVEDLRALAAEEREAELRRRFAAESMRPFDLTRDLMIRATLFACGPDEHVLFLTLHHIAADGLSLGIFYKELSDRYAAALRGAPARLPQLPVQYADFTLWQRAWLQGDALEARRTFWKKHLAGAPALLSLPTDRPRPPVQSNRGASAPIRIDAGVTEALRALGRRSGATLFMTLLAAFDVLLARHSGQEDIVVGVTVAGRPVAALEPLIGNFASTMALRADLSGNPTFLEHLARVSAVLREAYEVSDFPIEQVVEALQIERSLAHSPLYQALLVLQSGPPPSCGLEGVTTRQERFEVETTRFDVVMDLTEVDGGLAGVCTYNADIFDAPTIERMVRHFQALLAGIAADPAQRIEQIPMLSDAEREEQLARWNDTAAAVEGRPVHELFAAQARRTPDAPAAVLLGAAGADTAPEIPAQASLTYRELDERANQLAHHLRALGVGRDTLVGAHLERSLALPVALLGIHKAGGAYLPLDPSYPEERIAFMLGDAGAKVVLSQARLAARLPAGAAPVIALDTDWPRIAGRPVTAPEGGARPDDLAYVIYTSGSTGRPKGVMIEHRGLSNYLRFAAREYGVAQGGGALLCSSIGFDLTVTSLFAPLIAGAPLFLLPPGDEIQALAAELRRRRGLSFLKITPSHLSLLEQLVPAAELAAAARVLVIGGEALGYEAIAALRAQPYAPRIVNEYGPTETVVGCCVHEVRPGERGSGPVPIGRPIDNIRLYVLDRHLEPVPAGVTGELYIGGAQVARGYLNRPALDAERFIADRFAPRGKLYRTGDLARRRPDGALEFLGRADRQVKLHGFRIELGEIEAAIREFPGVGGAAVVLRADPRERLVAYVTTAAGAEWNQDALRAHLAARLPHYMVPAAIARLDELPLTAHGKVDTGALPAPEAEVERAVSGAELPESPAEVLLARIFCEVLGLSAVGVDDRFFRLGGDSISSVQVVARARRAGLELSLQDIFQHQTIRELARCAGSGAGADAGAGEVRPPLPRAETTTFGLISAEDRARLPEDIEDAYPAAAVQLAMLFFSGLDAGAHVYHSVSSHHVRARFDAEAWRQAVAAVIERHPVLRCAFDLSRLSEPLLLVHRRVEPPVQIHDLRGVAAAGMQRAFSEWLAAEQQRPFPWAAPPLFRIHVHRTGEEACRLTVAFHHALLDGWSLAVVVTEILQGYAALLRGERAALPPLASTYRDFIALERAALADPACRGFWDDLLADAPVMDLPRWPPSLRERDRGPGFLNVPLEAPLGARLLALADREAIPLKSVLLAAHALVLSRLSGKEDVLLGLSAHGRPETAESAELVGNFLNVLPLRVEVAGGTWLSLCRAVLDAEQRSLPFRHHPLAEIQKRAGGKRLFETAFNFIHFHVARRLGGVDDVAVLEVEGVAPGEMTLQANFALDALTGRVNLQLTYDPAALCRAQIEAIAGYYQRALLAMSAEPEGRYEQCSVLSEAERRRVLVEWNGPATELGARPLVHREIAAQAARRPDAAAVMSVDPAVPALTYRELDGRANQLARHLRALSIGPGSVIGMHVERSPEMLVALLAALRSGAAYVPLDPQLPRDRRLALLEQTRPDIVLHMGSPPDLPGVPRLLSLDREWSLVSALPATDPGVPVSPSDLAYILFTSGSTGTPKGAQITQGNLAAFMDSARAAYGIQETDRVLQFCTLAFDTSIEEIYITLMQGGTLVLRDDLMVSSPERFITACERLGLTALHLPTAYWHMLTGELAQKGVRLPPSVRVVFIGGEAALPQRVHDWYRRFGDRPALVNTYGTTETTAVISTFTLGDWEERSRGGLSFPVGRPLPTAQAYVLDRHMMPAPIGTPGELYIGGPQVGPGYWELPELAAERYLENPFGPGRVYRAGDLVRWLPDGTLECCGRVDDQVKIRGFRVEPGEVESALAGHPGVRGAAVLVREERPGDRRLVAYAAIRSRGEGAEGESVSAASLRRYLQQKLPEYAVPSEIVLLDALPLTPNGKLDRRALQSLRAAAAPEGAGDDGRPACAPPRNATEERLAAIFAEVLGCARVGVLEDFFDLGGSSLSAMQISSRIHGAFEVELPFRPILEHPSVAALAAYIEGVRAARPGAQTGSGARLERIPEERRAGRLPVTHAQQRLWFLDQLGQGAAYHLATHAALTGPLAVPALHLALQAIVDRHEVLRSTYLREGSEVYQVISRHAWVDLPVVDLRGLPPEEREAEVQRLHAEEAQRPFDLGRDLMIRCRLFRLADEEHRLFCTIHHIAADAWSLNLFNEELAALYSAFERGLPSPLPPLAAQYADFAAHERGRDLGPTLAYWKEKLKAPLPVLELPLDHPAPAVQDSRGGTRHGRVPAALLRELGALGRREGATLFMVLTAAFDVLLHRWTGAEDIVIGIPSVGRIEPETERMLGLFINTLVLRTDLSSPEDGPLTFRALLRRVRESMLDAFAHQDAPFEKLVEELQPDRLPGRDPIFEVMLNLVSVPDSRPQPGSIAMTIREEEEAQARRAMTLYMKEQPDGLALTLTYQRALFAPERMAALVDQFTYLLHQAAADPDRPLPAFSLVTPAARALLPDLREVLPRPPQEPIAHRLAEWAARAPDSPAVEWRGRTASYAELLRDAERIARCLLARGAARGDVAAIHGVRSYGTVAAMFGVLMSGCVMLTLEATLPEQRQRVMLDEAGAKLVLTVQGAEGVTGADHLARDGRALLVVDAATGDVQGGVGDLPLPAVSGDDPAYIVFTSGTTGKPKAVLGVHRGITHFLSWQRETFGIGPGDRCAELTGLSFDVVLRDMLLAPTSGATLCLPPHRMELDPPRLFEWLERNRITVLHPVPSLAATWLQHAPGGFQGTSLRWTFFAGEPLSDGLVRRWREVLPGTGVGNFYGPSETTMAKCCHVVPPEPPPGIQPVGRPLPQTQALVLDPRGRLCGVGELGQIVIRTPFRTLGYLNAPEDQRRFLQNPERDDPEDWLYYTGDRGRYRPDGSLDILGRVDDQIKIRGVRVEPAEIKAVLDQHPAVGGSAVIASMEGGEPMLIAYVTRRAGGPLDLRELRRYLGQRMHSALVPSAFVELEAIPVTSNGKVDRRALPAPAPEATEAFGVPRTEKERALVEIWQEVLGRHAVGIHDNFFDLGGHSLLAVHLVARIEQRFGQRLPPAALFESPTVETLATRLRRADAGGWSPLVPIQPKGTRRPFFCAPGLGGNVLYLYQLSRLLGPDQPFYGLQAQGLDGVTPPHTSIEAMAADHIRLIREVQPLGPYLLGGHSFGGRVAFEMAQQLIAAGHEVGAVVLLDCSPPFTLVDEGLAERDEVDMLEEMTAILGFMTGKAVRLPASELRAMLPEERLRAFRQQMEMAGVLPPDASPDHVRGWLSVISSNYRMALDYRAREVRPVRLVYYCAAEHPPAYAARRVDEWHKLGPLELHVVPGSHLGMMGEPHLQVLAGRLSERLEKLSEAHG